MTADRTKWGVQLVGQPSDLADWEQALKQPFGPWVDRNGEEFALCWSGFDSCGTAVEVQAAAASIIEQLNGAMQIACATRPVRFDGIVEFRSDGTRSKLFFVEAKVEMRLRAIAGAGVIGPDGKVRPPPPPQQSEVQNWAALGATDDLLADALAYFSRATWFDIYKAIESLEHRVGGETALGSKNYIAMSEFKRLKRTANFHRHYLKGIHQLPANPPTHKEGLEMLAILIRKALEEAAATP